MGHPVDMKLGHYLPRLGTPLNVKALLGAFNLEKAL